MSNDEHSDLPIEKIRKELQDAAPTTRKRVFEKFVLAALGSIPWVGGFISAAASFKTEEGSLKTDDLQTRWLHEHEHKMGQLGGTLQDVAERFESLGPAIEERIQSEEYLDLVRKSFRAWDNADTNEKRRYTANLIVNAAGTRVCSDDVVRLFVDWLDHYHEAHLAVIREIFRRPGSTRLDIWRAVYGEQVREDSAEADLYKLLIRDLSTGSVIRQHRQTTPDGQFLRTRTTGRRGRGSGTMESAFEATKQYELTELGKQFVHYTMSEVVGRLESE
ncbi:hypothetical protein [Woeseia oceani]|uniref:Uncharacterized protein n=1 Tax=Woeseia oceani TaxID=1548547 RepID=A0A193LE72_9GAMM|nr:hypothetical protein [Woeseia oceani]ANO50684.1 hypothetical protein BA177_05205 [Woeseia oceani]